MHAIEGTSNVPAFLTKLWRLVDDHQTNDLICWTKNGRSFIIQNQAMFARELLPQYYKHNNMASFVRQLNMYGFHKVASADSGGLRLEKDEMEFAHPAFQQGREELIENIRRKQQRRLASDGMDFSQIPTSRVGVEDNKLGKLLNDVRDMKRDHDTMSTKLLSLKRENEALWREYANMRQKFSKQQQIIEKLIHFLVAMVKSPSNPIIPKRKFGHLALEGIEEAASLNTIPQLSQNVEVLDGLSSGTMGGAQIHEVTDLIDSNNPSAIPEIFAPDPANTALEMEEIPVNESEGTILLVDGEPFLEATDLSIPSTSVPIKATNVRSPSGSNLWPEIQNSKLLDEAPLSPELLNTVDPSDVTQSFKYAATPPGSTVTQSPTTIITTSSAGTRLVSGPGKVQIAGKGIKKSPGRGKLKAMKISDSKSTTQPSVSTVAQPSLSFVAQPSRNSITQPNMSVAVPDKTYNKVLPDISAITDLAQYSKGSLTARNNTTNTRENESIDEQPDENRWLTRVLPDICAITDLDQYSKGSLTARNNATNTLENEIIDEQPDENQWLTRGDIQTHMDDMQNSIESLQEIMSSGSFNLDPTVLLSMFGSDDTLPELDSMAAATGNEISLYNPSLLDLADMADDTEDDPMKFLNRSSVASTSSSSAAMTPSSYSSTAKSKSRSSNVPLAVSIKEENVCDELSTPKILTPVQSPIFCGKKRRK